MNVLKDLLPLKTETCLMWRLEFFQLLFAPLYTPLWVSFRGICLPPTENSVLYHRHLPKKTPKKPNRFCYAQTALITNWKINCISLIYQYLHDIPIWLPVSFLRVKLLLLKLSTQMLHFLNPSEGVWRILIVW